jgi:hypothetical protein
MSINIEKNCADSLVVGTGCADGLAVGIGCADSGRQHSSAMITNKYKYKKTQKIKNCDAAIGIGYADGGRQHSSAYADGNHVLTVILLACLILILCRRPRQIVVGTVAGRRALVSFP